MSFTMENHYFSPSASRKSRPASVSSSGFHSQRRRFTYSLSSSVDSVNTSKRDIVRRSEKEILQALNDRFAGYIDKVRRLETHNHNLETEAAALRQGQGGRASMGEHYERELEDLRAMLQQLCGERTRTVLEQDRLEEDIHHVRAKLEDEARSREELEAAARAMKKYAEECRLARQELDKKLRVLEEESAFLKKNHEEEVEELLAQIQGAQGNFDEQESLKTDVTSALREIRAQLDSHATSSAMHTEEWFKVRMEKLSEAAFSNQDAIRATQEELADYRRQLQSRTIELETLRGTKESLERQRMESEDRHQDDLNSLQETINQLDRELKSTKWEMAGQLRDYQELLNVKMALDIEITSYRKLLEGEETRFTSGGGPYTYLDSRFSEFMKVKGEEFSDRVIVEETHVTEVTEEAEEEDEEEKEDTKEGVDKDEEDLEDGEVENSKPPARKAPDSKSPQKSIKSSSVDEPRPEPEKAASKGSPRKDVKTVKDEKKISEQPGKDEKKSQEKETESRAEKSDYKKESESLKPAALTKDEPTAQKADKIEPEKQDSKKAEKTPEHKLEVKKEEKREEAKTNASGTDSKY